MMNLSIKLAGVLIYKQNMKDICVSKYLKNLEERLGAPLFDRRENHYYTTYMGERYLYYAERIAAFGDQWSQEFDDIADH